MSPQAHEEYQLLLSSDESTSIAVTVPPANLLRHWWKNPLLHKAALLVLGISIFWLGRMTAIQHGRLDVMQPRVQDLACLPFLPDLFMHTPVSMEDPSLRPAVSKLQRTVDELFAARDIDGISIAVITGAGTVFEAHRGMQRANESRPSPSVDGASQYRVASVSKLLLVYEAWLLQERGIIAWTDPVEMYLPSFKPNYTSFSSDTSDTPIVTMLHLASHLSGLGHDWPPGNISRFPEDLHGAGPPPINGLPFPSPDDVLAAVQAMPLVTLPGRMPVYSNTAFGVLGMALVAANQAKRGADQPTSIADLMRQDVFQPLKMADTHFRIRPKDRPHTIVPSSWSTITDIDFLDAMNPSGGMFTSLEDMAKFICAILSPTTPSDGLRAGVLRRSTLDAWLRPVHTFAEDDWTELGAPWEIFKHIDSHGRRRRIYAKYGELSVFHAVAAIHPGSGYGVVVLMSGNYGDAAGLAYTAFNTFQPAFDVALEKRASNLYAGHWRTVNGSLGEALISVRQGVLWLDQYVLDGLEVLNRLFRAPEGQSIPLKSTGRYDELRLDVGSWRQNGLIHRGCMPHWAGFDAYATHRHASVALIYFTGGEDGHERVMHIPAAGVVMYRM